MFSTQTLPSTVKTWITRGVLTLGVEGRGADGVYVTLRVQNTVYLSSLFAPSEWTALLAAIRDAARASGVSP